MTRQTPEYFPLPQMFFGIGCRLIQRLTMYRPSRTTRLSSWLAAALLLLQVVAPFFHLAAHALHHDGCPAACSTTTEAGHYLTDAAVAHHACATCQAISQSLGHPGVWSPSTPTGQILSASLRTPDLRTNPARRDFNVAAARGPPAFSLTAV